MNCETQEGLEVGRRLDGRGDYQIEGGWQFVLVISSVPRSNK